METNKKNDGSNAEDGKWSTFFELELELESPPPLKTKKKQNKGEVTRDVNERKWGKADGETERIWRRGGACRAACRRLPNRPAPFPTLPRCPIVK